jgi:hypothetical protein
MIFAGSLLVLLASRAAQWRSLGWSLATGVAMGLSLTLKSHFAVFVLGALALLAIECRKSLKELVWLEAATMVGLVIGLAPLVARNVAVGVSPLSLGSAGAITFILGNVREAPSDASSFEVRQTAEIIGRTGGRFLPTVAATIATHGHGIS